MQKDKIKIPIILEPLYFKKGHLHILEKYWRYMELKLFVIPKIKKMSRTNSLEIFSREKTILSFLKSQGLNNTFLVESTDNESVTISKNVKKTVDRLINEKDIKLEEIDVKTVLEYDLLIRLNILYNKIYEYEDIYNKTVEHINIETFSSYDGKILKYLSKKNNKQVYFFYPKFYRKIRSYIFKRMSYNDLNFLRDINIYSDKSTSKNKGKVILVDAVYINYLRNIAPVLKDLVNKHDYQFYYIAKEKDLKQFNIEFTKLKWFKSKIMANKEVNVILDSLFSDENILKAFDNDSNVLIFKEELYRNYEKSLNYLLMKLMLSKNFASEIRPNLILVGDDRSTVTRIGILPFKEKVNIIEIQHGLFGPIDIYRNLMTKPISDKICVWGNSSKEFLTKVGLSKEKIEITGSPQFDRLGDLRNTIKTNKEKILLFTTQAPYKNINIKVIEEIGKNNELNDFVLYVKPHPDEDPASYKYLEDKFPNNVFIKSENENLYNLLVISDIVLLVSSSVGLEAAILDKPLICINFLNENLVYVNNGIALEVKNIEELIIKIKGVFNTDTSLQLSEKRGKFIEEYAYKIDGKSTERIIKIIQNLINM